MWYLECEGEGEGGSLVRGRRYGYGRLNGWVVLLDDGGQDWVREGSLRLACVYI